VRQLASDPDNLLLLDCDDAADALAWEFATLPERQFLCVKAGMLRTVQPQQTSEDLNTSEVPQLNFIALAADPLVDQQGQPREGYRLDLDNEMRAIRETLEKSGKRLSAFRIPPTRDALIDSLMEGSAILHLSCHGNVVKTENGPMAVLALETEDGTLDPFLGADLLNVAPRGALRLVLLSACYTATGTQANLARALALNGVPFTIGMQNPFPDPLSDDLAVKLYRGLLAGLKIGEALRLTRVALAREIRSVGLPVGYISTDGWNMALSVGAGTPAVSGLGKPGAVALGGEIQPPRPLLGRNRELHQIASHFASGRRVITVAGTGGMGKTALAAAFAERFAWKWPRGVRGYSFANEVNAANFRYALMRALFGDQQAQQGVGLTAAQQREAILGAAREWNGLWLFDNYESVLDEKDSSPEAEAIHRLIYDLANGGAAILLTSRNQPAELPNELLYPEGSHALRGLGDEAGVALFFQHSVKAKENVEAHLPFALEIQHAAEGHPLAIALLAGEYDASVVTKEDFLKDWQGELAAARRSGLSGHHVTFTTAFERSFSHLSADLKTALTCLSIFTFPFFAQGLEFMSLRGAAEATPTNEETASSEEAAAAQRTRLAATLNELTRRSLLEVDGWYKDDTPATYRFQPALRQEAASRLDAARKEDQQRGYAKYNEWFVNLARDEIGRQPSIARLALASLGELIKNADLQPEDKAARYCWQLGIILYQLGFTHEADAIQQKGADIAKAQGNDVWRERILFQQARMDILRGRLDDALTDLEECARLAKSENNEGEYSVVLSEIAKIYITRGDLDRALALYQESLQLLEQLGDKKGKAASLHNMAQVFLTRGDLDRALALYQESLQLKEQLGDKQGKAASLHNMAQVFLTRGDLDRALALYQESTELSEQLGDKQGKAASLHNMAQVFLKRGDLDRALALYQESLQLKEQLGDKKGKAASLSNMANVYWEKKEYGQAQHLMEQSIEIRKQVGDLEGIAYDITKLGQLCQVRGDRETALARYHEGLAIFEKLGAQPLIAQVKQLIASLEGGASPSPTGRGRGEGDPLAQVLAQARAAGDVQSAIGYQEQAVSLARERGQAREALVTLSVLLYNLAGYYQKAERHEDALKAMQEVVALDEQTGHEDLQSDRETLEDFRRIAAMSPEERTRLQNAQAGSAPAGGAGVSDFERQLQAQLAQLPPEQRAAAEAQIRKAFEEFQRMSPEEQAAVLDGERRAQIENAANQVRDAGVAFFRRRVPLRDVLGMLEGASRQMKQGESAGSPWLEAAALCDAIIALVKGEPVPPVPSAYAGHFAAVVSEKK